MENNRTIKEYLNSYIGRLSQMEMGDVTRMRGYAVYGASELQDEINALDKIADIVNDMDPHSPDPEKCKQAYKLMRYAFNRHDAFADYWGILVDTKTGVKFTTGGDYHEIKGSLMTMGSADNEKPEGGIKNLLAAQKGIKYAAYGEDGTDALPIGEGTVRKVGSGLRGSVKKQWEAGLEECLGPFTRENNNTLRAIQVARQKGETADRAIKAVRESEEYTLEALKGTAEAAQAAATSIEKLEDRIFSSTGPYRAFDKRECERGILPWERKGQMQTAAFIVDSNNKNIFADGLDHRQIQEYIDSVNDILAGYRDLNVDRETGRAYPDDRHHPVSSRSGALQRIARDADYIIGLMTSRGIGSLKKDNSDGGIKRALLEEAMQNGVESIAWAEMIESQDFYYGPYDQYHLDPAKDLMIVNKSCFRRAFREVEQEIKEMEKRAEIQRKYQEALDDGFPIAEGHPDNLVLPPFGCKCEVEDDGYVYIYDHDRGRPALVHRMDGCLTPLKVNRMYDQKAYTDVMESAKRNGSWPQERPDTEQHGPSTGRAWHAGAPDLYIEGFSQHEYKITDDEMEWPRRAEDLSVKNAFDENGKLTEEAQMQVSDFIKTFSGRFKEPGGRNIVIMDNRSAAKVMELDEEAIFLLETGASLDKVAEAIVQGAFLSEYSTHTDRYDENGDAIKYTVQDDIHYLVKVANAPDPKVYDQQLVSESIEHLHDVMAVCDSVQNGTFAFLDGSQYAIDEETRGRINEIDLAVEDALSAFPQIKQGFSLYADISPMAPEETLDAAVYNMMDFMDGPSPGRPGRIGSAELVYGFTKKTEDLHRAIENMESQPDLTPRQEWKIETAQEMETCYIQYLRLAVDRNEELCCRAHAYALPEGECGLYVDGLPDKISTEAERSVFEASMQYRQYRGYGRFEWDALYTKYDERPGEELSEEDEPQWIDQADDDEIGAW